MNEKNYITLKEWLDEWLEIYARPYLKKSTLVSYDCYIKKHISPKLGDILLSDLNVEVIQKFFNSEYLSGRLDNRGGLSEKTVQNIRMMFHAALKSAVSYGLIDRNFIEYVRLPNVIPKEMRVLTVAEQQKLLKVLLNACDEYAIAPLLCLATGIRVGEVCGLRWKDIDFDKRIIRIRRTVQRIANLDDNKAAKTFISVDTPKSPKSVRNIPVNASLIDLLVKHRIFISDTFHSSLTDNEQYIISHSLNTPVEPRTIQDAVKRYARKAKIDNVTLHSLRHTFATRAVEIGIDYKVLSALLGHADISTTMNRYVHVLDDKKKAAMDKILSQLF